jgi:hypothetical protein
MNPYFYGRALMLDYVCYNYEGFWPYEGIVENKDVIWDITIIICELRWNFIIKDMNIKYMSIKMVSFAYDYSCNKWTWCDKINCNVYVL